MERLGLLKTISFGQRVAEDETAALAGYFVETDQWERILKGEIDVVRGEKGSGKSAIYSLLIAPRGFSPVVSNMPLSKSSSAREHL